MRLDCETLAKERPVDPGLKLPAVLPRRAFRYLGAAFYYPVVWYLALSSWALTELHLSSSKALIRVASIPGSGHILDINLE